MGCVNMEAMPFEIGCEFDFGVPPFDKRNWYLFLGVLVEPSKIMLLLSNTTTARTIPSAFIWRTTVSTNTTILNPYITPVSVPFSMFLSF